MSITFFKKVKGILFNSSETFGKIKEEPLKDTLKYYFFLLCFYALLTVIIRKSEVLSWLLVKIPEGIVSNISAFVGTLILGLIEVFIFGLWLHLWLILNYKGTEKEISQTLKVVMYSQTPLMLFSWIPVSIINAIIGIWAIRLGIEGLNQLQGVSRQVATSIMIEAVGIPAIIIFALVVIKIF